MPAGREAAPLSGRGKVAVEKLAGARRGAARAVGGRRARRPSRADGRRRRRSGIPAASTIRIRRARRSLDLEVDAAIVSAHGRERRWPTYSMSRHLDVCAWQYCARWNRLDAPTSSRIGITTAGVKTPLGLGKEAEDATVVDRIARRLGRPRFDTDQRRHRDRREVRLRRPDPTHKLVAACW